MMGANIFGSWSGMSKEVEAVSNSGSEMCVSVSRDDARQMASLLDSLLRKLGPFDRGLEASSAACSAGAAERFKKMANNLYLARRRRSKFFSRGISGEPAWDMLLALYGSDVGRRGHTTTEVVEMSAAAPTTALRWLEYLIGQGLFQKEASPIDRRIVMIHLTLKARQALDQYFESLEQQRLSE